MPLPVELVAVICVVMGSLFIIFVMICTVQLMDWNTEYSQSTKKKKKNYTNRKRCLG